MKFSIEKKELLNAMQHVKKAITSNNANPILDGMLIDIDDSKIKLLASDSTLQIQSIVPINMQEPGTIVLPGALFIDIASRLPDDEVYIESSESSKSIKLSCGNFKMNLQGENASSYPEMPEIEDGKSVLLSQSLLKDMINKTIFSIAQDQARPILTGVLFEILDNELSLVALSSNRMAIRKESVTFDGEINVVIPASSLSKIVSILGNDEESMVEIKFGKSNAFFKINETIIHCGYLAGEFLKYRNIIPNSHKLNFSVDRKELNSALERASLISREADKKFVKLDIESDQIIINASSEYGNVQEKVNIQASGPSLETAFNAKYLQDVLSKLDDQSISMYFQSGDVAGIIKSVHNDSYLYLIAPVQL